jgi:hypothetical protein
MILLIQRILLYLLFILILLTLLEDALEIYAGTTGTLAVRLLICCFKIAVLLYNNYIIYIPCGPQYLFGPRLGCAREYGSVMVDQKIVSDHEKCAIFVIATMRWSMRRLRFMEEDNINNEKDNIHTTLYRFILKVY